MLGQKPPQFFFGLRRCLKSPEVSPKHWNQDYCQCILERNDGVQGLFHCVCWSYSNREKGNRGLNHTNRDTATGGWRILYITLYILSYILYGHWLEKPGDTSHQTNSGWCAANLHLSVQRSHARNLNREHPMGSKAFKGWLSWFYIWIYIELYIMHYNYILYI